jgi:hypothetical protein
MNFSTDTQGMPPDFEGNIPPEIKALAEEMKAAQMMKVDQIGKEVAKKRDEAVKTRKQSGIEDQWEEDEEYYQGVDDTNRDSHPWIKSASTSGGISRQPQKANTRCTSFFNITGQFVDSAAARMGDILLPAGDWNFSVNPTPLPDDGNPQSQTQLGQLANTPQAQQQVSQQSLVMDNKAEKAETWIKDKLTECSYHSEVRKVIEDAAKLGVGVLKGPFPDKVTSCKSKQGANGVTLEIVESVEPVSKRIDPWDFFPDPACGDNIHKGGYTCERDRISPKQLKGMKDLPGYLADQIDHVLHEGPNKKHLGDNGQRKSGSEIDDSEMFEVWYFYGLIPVDSFAAIGSIANKPPVKDGEPTPPILDDKDLSRDMLPAIVTMVNDTPIKAAINPMDTGDFPYDVMAWQPVKGSWTGVGVARKGRTPQDMLNASARNLMDNAGLSGGPMIIIKDGAIMPQNGIWEISPRKVWRATEAYSGDLKDAFTVIEITMVQEELTAIIQLAYKMMEDATGIAYLLQGQQGSAPDTVGGMELLHRNASAILRFLARVFDERITEPHIKRYYDWLLLNGPDDAKGDMKIEAIGSTALVEREIQAQDSMTLLNLAVNPIFGLDPAKAIIEVLKAKRFIPEKWTRDPGTQAPAPVIPAIEVAKIRAASDEKIHEHQTELDQWKAKVETQYGLKEHEVVTAREQIYAQTRQMEVVDNANARAQELQVKKELAIMDYANKRNISLDQVKASLASVAMKLRTQRILSGVPDAKSAPQVITPDAEPVQHAPDGMAFQE